MTESDFRKKIEEMYDHFYSKAEDIIKTDNPCRIKKENGKSVCNLCRFQNFIPKDFSGYHVKPNKLCCDGCEHHDPSKGCQAEKPLACKLSLCWMTRKLHPFTAYQLDALEKLVRKTFGMLRFRGNKKQTIDFMLKSSSIQKLRKACGLTYDTIIDKISTL